MTVFRKYKTIVTAFLMVLYAFIATPVQLWHHHATPANAAPASGKFNQDAAGITIKGQYNSDNCSICSHEYAVCSKDAVTPQVIKVTVRVTVKACYLLSITTPPYFDFSNKGPPVKACSLLFC